MNVFSVSPLRVAVVAQLVASVTLVECVTACAALLFAVTGHAQDTSIRPFMVNVPEEAFVDLRRRLAATAGRAARPSPRDSLRAPMVMRHDRR